MDRRQEAHARAAFREAVPGAAPPRRLDVPGLYAADVGGRGVHRVLQRDANRAATLALRSEGRRRASQLESSAVFPDSEGGPVSLVFNQEQISARELKPALFELDGISRETVEAHYKLYQGYVAKRNEIMEKLDGIDLASANQVYSEIRALKVELSFAIGGIKNPEIYFENPGGGGGGPGRPR